MIDIKDLRQNPDIYRQAAADKAIAVDIDALLASDEKLRSTMKTHQDLVAEKNRIGKEIGQLAGRLRKARDTEQGSLQQRMKELQDRPNQIKAEETKLEIQVAELRAERDRLLLKVPQPAASHVPVAPDEAGNVEISRWNPPGFDPSRSFEENRGFQPRSHIELGKHLSLFDFERGVAMAGSRSYVLTGAGMMLHNAVLQAAFAFMTQENGFKAVSVPVLVRDHVMTGTGFFPGEKDQAYEIGETQRGGGHDLYLTGTGEVGLMGLHQEEILSTESLPRCYTTLSTCFRREAGSAGKDTAGLYRIHQFDKVEQVVLCEADLEASKDWHQKMIGYVEAFMQRLALPYRLLQVCTGDMGASKIDQIDVETWMPSRGPEDDQGRPKGSYGETHSASQLGDYQCRRLNLRYRDPEDPKGKATKFCYSLNNTVCASPRILIPILEHYQNEDGTVSVPAVLRPYLGGLERIEATHGLAMA
ncbi:serine--tRNA ligase [Mucisphaera sp.]|uniref:serine--tRNA ligase n=1 Tax=Mucisphaera sp. TaxID=2913024 RepID=UPI003D0C4C76